MENITERINQILAKPEFADQFSNVKSQDEVKKLFDDQGLNLSDEDVNGFMQEIQKRFLNLPDSKLEEISGGKCAISKISEGVGDIAKGVGRGIGYTVGGVAKGAGSLAYNTAKGVGKIAWGAVEVPTNIVVEAGKGFWKGLTK